MKKNLRTRVFTQRLSRLLILGIGVMFAAFATLSFFASREFMFNEAARDQRVIANDLPDIVRAIEETTTDQPLEKRLDILFKRFALFNEGETVAVELSLVDSSMLSRTVDTTYRIRPVHHTTDDIFIPLWLDDSELVAKVSIRSDNIHAQLLRLSLFDFISAALAILLMAILVRFATRAMAQPMIDEEAAERERAEHELDVARDIQRSMQPADFMPFPERPKLELFAQLDACHDVGGDFYDFARLDNAHLFITVGDAAGVGIPAALMMVIGRSILRNAIYKHRHTAYALTAVSQELATQRNPVPLALFCGVFNIYTGHLHWAAAGYPAVTIYDADGHVKERLTGDPQKAGEKTDLVFTQHSTYLAAGETLAIVSDGLLEAADASNVLFSQDRVDQVFKHHKDGRIGAALRELSNNVKFHTKADVPSDDVTVLALRSHYILSGDPSVAPADAAVHTAPNQLKALPALVEWIEQTSGANQVPAAFGMILNLVVEEWFVNIVSYAFTDKEHHDIRVRMWFTPDALWMQFEDDGIPYDPTVRTAVDIDLPLEQRGIGGLGVHFIRQTMDIFHYARRDNKNVVTLMKRTDVPQLTL